MKSTRAARCIATATILLGLVAPPVQASASARGAHPAPRAHAALGQTTAACDRLWNYGGVSAAHTSPDDIAWQVMTNRTAGIEGCNELATWLQKLTGEIGAVDTFGQFPVLSLNGTAVQQLAAGTTTNSRIGTCPVATAVTACTDSLAKQVRTLTDALGAWDATGSSYPAHTLLWLTDKAQSDTAAIRTSVAHTSAATDDVLSTLRDVRQGVQEVASNTMPATTGSPSSTVADTVALADDDRALMTDNQAELASILWVIVGVLCALVPCHALLRELSNA